MVKTLPLIRGELRLSEALDDNSNVLLQLSLPLERDTFFTELSTSVQAIEAIVADHLAVPRADCKALKDRTQWIHGSFNVCIPLLIQRPGEEHPQRVLIRIPLPYKSPNPDNVDEKVRSEAATYIWMAENCPQVPIPGLLGFGFSNGLSFTPLSTSPLLPKLVWYIRGVASWLLGRPLSCRYTERPREALPNMCYLLLEYVEHGALLSKSWELFREDKKRRSQLFYDLSRIILSMARIPLPRIGSWTINNQGILSLTNRPLTAYMQQLESEHIPTDVGKDMTYDNVDSYYLDILAYHDNRIKLQPNAIQDQIDGRSQLAYLTIMKALTRHFTERVRRHGPFVMQLTDIHQGNIFVDENWRVTKLIDLEWACARPEEMILVPYWITGQPLDNLKIDDDATAAFEAFLQALEQEAATESEASITQVIRRTWDSGGYWFFNALDAPDCLYGLFLRHIQPRFLDPQSMIEDTASMTAPFWTPNVDDFIRRKVADKEKYDSVLEKLFANS